VKLMVDQRVKLEDGTEWLLHLKKEDKYDQLFCAED
jgi:hypothetical protein